MGGSRAHTQYYKGLGSGGSHKLWDDFLHMGIGSSTITSTALYSTVLLTEAIATWAEASAAVKVAAPSDTVPSRAAMVKTAASTDM